MYLLGIDVGTTGTKAMLADREGNILAQAYQGYQLFKPAAGCVEQSAEAWWKAFCDTVSECTGFIKDKQNIKALSISSQGGSLVPVDCHGVPLSNALVWMDSRGQSQLNEMLSVCNKDFYYERSGWRLNAGLNLIKIRWIRDNQPEIFKNTFKFLSTIDYIQFKLTGKFVIDPSNAAMTQLMNIKTGTWDENLLSKAGIGTEKLPEILPSCTRVDYLSSEAAAELGLNKDISVFNGGHDQYCAALGAGAIDSGDALLSTGTAWVVLGIMDAPLFDSSTYIAPGRHIIDGKWGALSSIPTGGASLEWFREGFALKSLENNEYNPDSLKVIDSEAEKRIRKAAGLFFYPYFNGTSFPNYNARVKASFAGLGMEHDRYDMALAIMEGIIFETKRLLDIYEEKGCVTRNLKFLGGASKSKLWTGILANTAGHEITILNEPNTACIGAIAVAGAGCGIFSSLKAAAEVLSKNKETVILPDKAEIDFYRDKYRKYKQGAARIEALYDVLI